MNFRKALLLGIGILGIGLFLSFGTGLTYLIERSRTNLLREHLTTELQQFSNQLQHKFKFIESTLRGTAINEDLALMLSSANQTKDVGAVVLRLDKLRVLSDLDFVMIRHQEETLSAYSVSERQPRPRAFALAAISKCRKTGFVTIANNVYYCSVNTVFLNGLPEGVLVATDNVTRFATSTAPEGYTLTTEVETPSANGLKNVSCETLENCSANINISGLKITLKANYQVLSSTWTEIAQQFGLILTLILVAFVLIALKTLDILLFKDLRKIISTSEEITRRIKKDGTYDHNLALNQLSPKLKEMRTLVSSFTELLTALSTQEKELSEKTKKAELGALASQVAHDIRSPLSALEMVLSSVTEIQESKRTLLRDSIHRIRDIANSLLGSYRVKQNEIKKGEVLNTLLFPLVESLVSEKRAELRGSSHVSIDLSQTGASYGLFSVIDPSLLKRILSNLINNSVEALKDNGEGKISVALKADKNQNPVLTIKDNGEGIPKNVIDSLGTAGVSHGKENGNGLGLHHAKKTITEWKGQFEIESIHGLGTQIKITLPKAEAPAWFLSKIQIAPQSAVVVMDDDQSVHHIWEGRLQSAGVKDAGIVDLLHPSTPDQFRAIYKDQPKGLYLVDYEINGTTETGLDMIESLGIKDQSILVTSRYAEPAIQVRCEQMGLKLLPKSMSGFVPLEVGKKS